MAVGYIRFNTDAYVHATGEERAVLDAYFAQGEILAQYNALDSLRQLNTVWWLDHPDFDVDNAEYILHWKYVEENGRTNVLQIEGVSKFHLEGLDRFKIFVESETE